MVSAMSEERFHDVRHFESLDSTNTYLLAEAKSGAADGVVVLADYQTRGRGRLGRTWEAPPGACLLTSILIRPQLPSADLHLCTAAVALAAAEACQALAGVTPLLKWPNDLVVGPKKLAGILAEVLVNTEDAEVSTPSKLAVVVGLGLNISWSGPEGVGGTSLVAEGGAFLEPQALLQAILRAFIPLRTGLDSSEGRLALAEQWRASLSTLGQKVRVELPNETFEGQAVDLTARGELIVLSQSGAKTVSAGDVVHLRAIS
jgi:BirA family transcriptional regulator, biotin operon repressor / biotin---[acetyl-CoA-carboxylase] ligase